MTGSRGDAKPDHEAGVQKDSLPPGVRNSWSGFGTYFHISASIVAFVTRTRKDS